MEYQNLTGYVNGTIPWLSPTITSGDTVTSNPAYLSWVATDQRALILIQSSLLKEAMAETLGQNTSDAVWTTLERAYRHASVERVHTLRDSVQNLKKGSSSVVEFSKKFKGTCDQPQATGQPISEDDKFHWILCGLGFTFETFSTT
ncbi:uncharacterized protein [Rutidosis leptorrhynchoides]|uniref:uncharacterized protein n=1 Tax=Rutidosis leptorrhynchoides TaxID=125765 RepID=UPI003A996A8F